MLERETFGRNYRRKTDNQFITDVIKQLENGKLVYLHYEHQLNEILTLFPNANWKLDNDTYKVHLEEL